MNTGWLLWTAIGLTVAWLLLLVIRRCLLAFIRWADNYPVEQGKAIAAREQALDEQVPDVVDVDPHAFQWLDLEWYDRVTAELKSQGFRVIGDFEDRTETRIEPYLRRFTRSFVSDDGTTTAGVFMIRFRRFHSPFLYWWIRIPAQRAVGLQTELTDGVRLCTDNLAGCAPDPHLSGVVRTTLPPETSVEELIRRHRASLRQALDEAPVERRPVMFRNREDVLEGIQRDHAWMREARIYSEVQRAGLELASRDVPEMKTLYEAYLHETKVRDCGDGANQRRQNDSHSPGM